MKQKRPKGRKERYITRILCIGHNLLVGGAQRVGFTLLRYLVARGAMLDACFISGGPLAIEVPSGLADLWIGDGCRRKALQHVVRKARQADVVFSLMHGSPAYLAVTGASLTNRPAVAWFHSRWGDVNLPTLARWHVTCSRFLYPRLSLAVCIMPDVAKDLTNLYPGLTGRTLVIPNFIDSAWIREQALKPPEGGHYRGEYIAAVGRFIKLKGFDTLLRAFEIVLKHLPKLRLVLVGDGSEMNNLKSLAMSLGIGDNVTFAGEVRNAYAVMAGARATIMSSTHEPFGMVILESMVVGTPVIALESEGPCSILGETFPDVLVPQGNVAALAEVIVRILSDGAWRESVTSRLEGTVTRFDISRSGPTFLDALEGVCTTKRRRETRANSLL